MPPDGDAAPACAAGGESGDIESYQPDGLGDTFFDPLETGVAVRCVEARRPVIVIDAVARLAYAAWTMELPSFFPLPPNRVWRTYLGGRVLDQIENKPQPADSHFPEDWIASTTRAKNIGREDQVDEGLAMVELDGERTTLAALIEAQPQAMLGADHVRKHGPNVGFLTKFLDSSIRLHIQAHPTVAFSQKHLGSNHGKTEGYYIVSTRPEVAEPYIYFGFQRPPDRDVYRRAILQQDESALLSPFDRVPVKPGDAFVVPGGVPHAIGEGVFMIEIMEPTDFAVRLEFERGGYTLPESARFMDRGVDFALDMLDFSPWPQQRIRDERFGEPRLVRRFGEAGVEESLIDDRLTELFQVRRLRLNRDIERSDDPFHIGIVTRGGLAVRCERTGQAESMGYGDRFFVPAATGALRYEPSTDTEIVLAMAGG